MNRLLSIVCIGLSLTIAGCGKSEERGDIVKRPGEPDYIRADDDEQLIRAMNKAKETYTQLIAALDHPDSRHHGYAVKKPFAIPTGGEEHIWINEVTWDGAAFHGVINNEPVDTKQVKLGDRVTVKPTELSDWMYIDGNRIVGGYTLRVLHYQQSPEDQKAFTDQTGLIVPPPDF